MALRWPFVSSAALLLLGHFLVGVVAQAPTGTRAGNLEQRFEFLEKLLADHIAWRERADETQRAIRKELRALRRAAAGGRLALAGPPPPPLCSASIKFRRAVAATAECVENKTFGCAVVPGATVSAMYVEGGCRGTFWCDGHASGICGVKNNPIRQFCPCTPNVTLREDLKDMWRQEARERVRAEREEFLNLQRIARARPGDREFSGLFRNECTIVDSSAPDSAVAYLRALPSSAGTPCSYACTRTPHTIAGANLIWMPGPRPTPMHMQVAHLLHPPATLNESALPAWHWANAHRKPPPNTSLPKLYWLHMPKAGTALMATIVRYACPDVLADAYAGPSFA